MNPENQTQDQKPEAYQMPAYMQAPAEQQPHEPNNTDGVPTLPASMPVQPQAPSAQQFLPNISDKKTPEEIAEHKKEACKRMSPIGRRFFELVEFDGNEDFVIEIRKHPFGMVLIWGLGIFVALILLFVPILLAAFLSSNSASSLVGNQGSTVQVILFGVAIFLALGALAVTLINVFLYKNNVIFVTSEKIAQVLYSSLFNRKISQMSIGDVQDVTVRQDGIFPRIFGYGKLSIETAGEQDNYEFTYVPDPYETSKLIVGAHEGNLHRYGN